MVLAKELRDAILQAAVTGSLTEQLDSDSSAPDLISEIKSEKERLLKCGIISKDNSFKAKKFTDDDLAFDIPASWVWVRLGDICQKIGAGSTPLGGSRVYVENGIKFIREQNVRNDGLDYSGLVYISSDIHNSMLASEVRAKDILVNITGASIGRNSLVPDDFDTANVNQHVLIVRMVNEQLRQYIHLCLCSPLIFNQMMDNQKGDKPGLSATRVCNFLIPIPPIEEQQRIVARVNELLAKLDEFEKIEQQLTALKASFPGDMRAAILQAAMQGKLTEQLETDSPIEELLEHIDADRTALIAAHEYKPNKKLRPLSDEEFPFDVPESWTWLQLGYCSTYGQTKAKATQEDIQSDVWSLDLEDIEKVSGKVIVKVRVKDRPINGDKIKFCKGNILYSKLRPYLLKILIADEDGICSPELIPFEMMGGINPRYILWVLRSPHIDYTINSVTYGVKMPRVGTETMINLLIPLPPIEEQQRIVERLDKLLPLCDGLIE